MAHFLNFGAGPNQLDPPWQNLGPAHDIRKPLRFDSASTRFILAEHVIEHAPFLQGVYFLQECRRLLETGGVLRLAFPDIGRFLTRPDIRRESSAEAKPVSFPRAFTARAERYAQALELVRGASGAFVGKDEYDKSRTAMLTLLVGWSHQSAWTSATACGVLLAIGFSDVRQEQYGRSDVPELRDIDGHHRDVGRSLAEMETTVVEARK